MILPTIAEKIFLHIAGLILIMSQSRHAKDAQRVVEEYVILSYITICKKTYRNGLIKNRQIDYIQREKQEHGKKTTFSELYDD